MRKVTVKTHKRKTKSGKVSIVRQHTVSKPSQKAVVGNILHLGSEIKEKYGEKGMFPHADGVGKAQSPTFQVIAIAALKEKGWRVVDWKNKKITAENSQGKRKSVQFKDYGSANDVVKKFGI